MIQKKKKLIEEKLKKNRFIPKINKYEGMDPYEQRLLQYKKNREIGVARL